MGSAEQGKKSRRNEERKRRDENWQLNGQETVEWRNRLERNINSERSVERQEKVTRGNEEENRWSGMKGRRIRKGWEAEKGR